ncbi:heat shock 70 kDa protein 14 [Patella vulgata]|uniref:heat shock 70 kDa protein 14 n=1 Tax=Patella vulgata TaxID=6465 RepID=UPI002180433D|nr:heat shock 70 kDa protein 14 [Patella vulgata]
MAAFGIHFGTCSACLAVYKEGQTDVIANDLGDRVTPCVVAFTDYEQSVGAAAKQGIIRNANNSICHVKQVIGRDFNDALVQDYISIWPVTVTNKDGFCQFDVDFKGKPASFSPVEIASNIYSKMLETAESHGGRGIKDAVLAVPSNFTPKQKELISESAVKAGFNVLRLINEPAAAALAYDLGQENHNEESCVLVLRLGGTSTDATILQVNRGIYQVVSSVTLEKYGGENFTDVLTENLVSEFKRQAKCDIRDNRRSMTKLRLAAEMCKHTLSTLPNAQCAVDSLYDGIDFHYNVSRGRFEILCNNLLQQCVQLIEQILRETKLTKSDINKVILCGGGANVPILQT